MKLLLSLLLLLSTTAFAQDIDLVQNGMRATCKSKYDVFTSLQRGSAYVLSDVKIVDAGRTVELTAKLTFVKCINDNGKFKFVVDNDHMISSYQTLPQADGSTETVTREDLEKNLIALSNDVEIIAKVKVDGSTGVQTVMLELPKPFLSTHDYPRSTHFGKYTVNLGIQSKTKITTETSDFGSSLRMGGMFRVFFEL